MTQIGIKRVYDEYSVEDGYRILIDKLWPRGIKKENLPFDLWAKEIAPSSSLRKWFHEDQEVHWPSFVLSYEKELENSEAVTDLISQIKNKNKITLLYASKNKEHNHAIILKEFLDRQLQKITDNN